MGAAARLGLYGLLVASPFIAAALGPEHEEAGETIFFGAGKAAALLGFSILAMQFVLSARIKWAERPFGLDRVMRFHKWMGVTAGFLILAHPLGLVLGGAGWGLIFSFGRHWAVGLGKIAFVLLAVLVIASVYRVTLRIEYQKWLLAHNAAAAIILVLGFVHSWALGDELQSGAMRTWWVILLAGAGLAFVNSRLIVPLRRRRRAHTVAEVRRETPNVWTIKMTPPKGAAKPDYKPGQFHFLTLYRGEGVPVEEHPFTISSSPSEEGYIASTIKESGDYTSTIGRTKPGDRAAVDGPFGRFSYLEHPGEGDLVFIAGGIGITPLRAMLRHMSDTGSERQVLLLYGNRTAEDIVFREELESIAAGGTPRLRVVHVLSEPKADWQGEKGYVDEEKIRRLCGDTSGKAFYICGPPVMMKKVIAALKRMGVPRGRIHYEMFSL